MNEERRRYYEEEARLIEESQSRLAQEYDLERNAKFDIAWSIAWQHGHSSGVHEVESYFRDLVPLLKP
jgi:hypothetical protein